MRSELFEEAWKQNRHVWESTKCLAQAMYLAGEQHQQSKVDELQASYHGEMIGHNHHLGKVKKERDELQKRVDSTLKVVQSMRNEVKHGHMSDDESQTLSSYANDLEQALKGGSND